MIKTLICLLVFLILALPVDAKRRNIEDFLKMREELIQKIPSPVINPTQAPTPTPKPAVLLPNDSEVQRYLHEATDNTASLSASITHTPSIMPRQPTPPQKTQSDQTMGIIASFITFAGVAIASYQGIFDRGVFKKL